MIEIDPSGDLVIKVTEIIKNDQGKQVSSRTEAFRARRQIMRKVSAPWSRMFAPGGPYGEGIKDVVEFDETPIFSFEVLLRELHHKNRVSLANDASILNVWQLLGLTKRWLILDIEFLIPWFEKWYSAQRYDDENLKVLEQRQLLFPCYCFDHPKGFAKATDFLAYHVCGHIQEINPIDHDELHLPIFTTRLLNSARYRLGTILQRQLNKTIKSLLAATCKCKGDTLWGYLKELETTGIWPFEESVPRNSINDLLEKLDKFDYKVANKNACTQFCKRDYNDDAEKARIRTEDYFQGLCLDCMDRKKPKLDDHHADYWNHNNFSDEDAWFKYCRVPHKQPSWYYSFMGRDEDKNALLARDKRRREQYYDNLWGGEWP